MTDCSCICHTHEPDEDWVIEVGMPSGSPFPETTPAMCEHCMPVVLETVYGYVEIRSTLKPLAEELGFFDEPEG